MSGRVIQIPLIFGLAIVSAVVYGILHDQVTTRVCIEYFTIGHPPVFDTQDPTLLAIGWGIIATWWAGAMLGMPLSLAAQVGGWPRRDAKRLIRPALVLLMCMGLCAAAAGFAGYYGASRGWVFLAGQTAQEIPADRHVVFIADLWAHLASYLSGFIGGIVLIVWVIVARWREALVAQAVVREAER